MLKLKLKSQGIVWQVILSFLLMGCGYAGSGKLELPNYSEKDAIIEHKAYALAYNEEKEQADWVAWELTKEELNGDIKRKNNFKPDPKVVSKTANDDDYYKSGYDRGHLAPAADMTWDEVAMDESFYYSNMSPQNPSFNRGIWRRLETQTRKWAEKYEKIYVVTGPVFTNEPSFIGPNKVAIPDAYYKTILITADSEIQGVGFIMPNKKGSGDLLEYAVTIDSVEKVTGIDFYPLLRDRYENAVESSVDKTFWE